jgi:hypothetical protein
MMHARKGTHHSHSHNRSNHGVRIRDGGEALARAISDPWRALAAAVLLRAVAEASTGNADAEEWLQTDGPQWAEYIGIDTNKVDTWLQGPRRLTEAQRYKLGLIIPRGPRLATT